MEEGIGWEAVFDSKEEGNNLFSAEALWAYIEDIDIAWVRSPRGGDIIDFTEGVDTSIRIFSD